MSSAISIDRARLERRERQPHPILGLVVQLVAHRARRRLTWLDALHRERGPGAIDEPDAEHDFYAEHEPLAPINQRIAELERIVGDAQANPLHDIATLFGLTPTEIDLLMTCIAPTLEPAVAELYGRLHGHRYATEPLAARLFGWGRRPMWSPAGGLATWALIQAVDAGPGQARPLLVDPHLFACMQGEFGVDAELVGVASLIPARSPLDSWPLASICARIETSLEHQQPLRVVVVGPEACGRRSFAAAVAQRLDVRALAIDCDDIDDDHWPAAYVRVIRLALISGVIPVWYGERIDRRWPKSIPPTSLQFVICEDPSKLRPQAGVVDERVVIPSPSLDERRMLWRMMVPSSAAWPDETRERLAARHRLTVGDIAEIGRRLPSDAGSAARHAREQTRGRLGELGQLLDCPFDWDDLVLADKLRETLEDFTFEASERAVFWEAPEPRRLFPRGTGLVALLTGPPGTGKTMAAQVVAAELELDLFRINLATVISKYIGETAKNLDRIFSRAARMNAVLLFDEADALF
ncbi:MAG TPA: AAA family ATPase, partial [Enhygromyxa sp.]|nr:AAA family ATPase [Enhygromyxa sp.]